MEDKIKIYIPDRINQILLKDMELFEFFKKDKTLNKNDFLNTLIVNYYASYQESNTETYTHIFDTISKETKSNKDVLEHVAHEILYFVEKKNYQIDNSKVQITISIKPTKKSSDIIQYINTNLLYDTTTSNYFRNMFASYAMLSQDRREQIIFKDNFNVIEEAIKEDKQIYFTLKETNAAYTVSPYSIAHAKEELFNYLIANNVNKPSSFRMSRIKHVVILNEKRKFEDNQKELLEKMIKYGPQFAYGSNEDGKQLIKVKMNKLGERMYEKIYTHRPAYVKKDNEYYYFDCSCSQAYLYFQRLGKSVIVVEPSKLAHDITSNFAMNLKAYNKELKAYENKEDSKDSDE